MCTSPQEETLHDDIYSKTISYKPFGEKKTKTKKPPTAPSCTWAMYVVPTKMIVFYSQSADLVPDMNKLYDTEIWMSSNYGNMVLCRDTVLTSGCWSAGEYSQYPL